MTLLNVVAAESAMKKQQTEHTSNQEFSQASDVNAALQPFKLVQYFAFTSLIVILLASFTLSWTISNNAKKILLERSESYSLLFAENLNRQVFLQFVLPTYVRYGRIALSNKSQFEKLNTIVRNITKGMKIDSVTIFDSNKNIISYSTIADLVGKENIGGYEYDQALEGDNNSILISRGSMYNLFPGAPPIYCKLKTFIPFRQEKKLGERSGNIMGVIEVVKDLTDDLTAIIKLQSKIMALSLTIMGMLLVALSVIVARGSRKIEKRAKERRRLEIKLHENERLAVLGKMVASVSHEIRNPLGIVRSTAEILGKRIKKVAPGNEHLASIIVEETSRLDHIVTEFLDFARPSEPKMKPTQINTVVDRIVHFLAPEFAQKGISLNLETEKALPEIIMDSEQIYQVLLNMIFNAIQAMPDEGTLTVKTAQPPGKSGVLFSITDTGIGMSQEKTAQIFTPFFTDKNRGTGLGLAIAKNIIDKHLGQIVVLSEKNHGSTFTVTLPGTTVPSSKTDKIAYSQKS